MARLTDTQVASFCPRLRSAMIVELNCLMQGRTRTRTAASLQKSPGVREMIEAAGATLLYLPPYSPDLNPIVRLLPEWDAGTVELNAVYASGRAAKPSARAFVDYLITALHETEPPPSSPPSIGEKPRPSA
jgi:DNA-binding transcriptional LysR family regulator